MGAAHCLVAAEDQAPIRDSHCERTVARHLLAARLRCCEGGLSGRLRSGLYQAVEGWRMNLVAFSGGKDSTAMVLRLHELDESFHLLFTPTGDELPELETHISVMAARVGREVIRPTNRTLLEWIAT